MTAFIRTIATTSAVALVMTMSATTITTLTATAAYADRGNGNGNGNANRGNSGKDRSESRSRGRDNNNRANNRSNGRGALASELGGLNAANANPNALQNASPNSMPGKLYTYQQTRQNLIDVVGVQNEAYDEYNRLAGLTEEEIAAEFPDGGYEDAVSAAARDYTTAREAALEAQSATEASLLVLTNGRELSPEATFELHRMLGF